MSESYEHAHTHTHASEWMLVISLRAIAVLHAWSSGFIGASLSKHCIDVFNIKSEATDPSIFKLSNILTLYCNGSKYDITILSLLFPVAAPKYAMI